MTVASRILPGQKDIRVLRPAPVNYFRGGSRLRRRGAGDHAGNDRLGGQPGNGDGNLAQPAGSGERAEAPQLLEVRLLEQVRSRPGEPAALRGEPLAVL